MPQPASRPTVTFDDRIDLDCPVEAVYQDLSQPPATGSAEPIRRPA